VSERNAAGGVRPNGHVDEMTGLLYLEGQLEPARGREVSRHAEECPACGTLLRALERESRLLTRAMVEEDEVLPARLLGKASRPARPLQWIWAAAFGLAATGVYALYTGYVQPWQRQLEGAGFGGSSLLNLLVFRGAYWKGWQSMISLFEVLALVTLGVGVLLFLRRRVRRTSAMALIFAGVAAAVALPMPARAADTKHEPNFVLGKDEVVHNDLYVATTRARVDGTVEGDLIIFTQSADINGHITGDLIIFGHTLRISGQVDGNIRAFSNTTTITGTVGKNVSSFSEVLNLDSGSRIGGGVTLFTQTAGFDGKIGRDIYGFLGTASISGLVGGNVWLKGDQMNISSGAEVKGKTLFKGKHQPTVSDRAKLASPVQYEFWTERPAYRTSSYYVWKLIWTAATALFGLVLFNLMPGFAQETANSASSRFGASLGLGVLVFFGVPIAAIVACVTVIGIPLGIGAVLLWLAALFSSQIVVGSTVGSWLLGPARETWGLIGRMAIGLVLVRLAFFIPHIGGWIEFGVFLWGMGAMSLAIYKRLQPKLPATGPAVPAAAAA